jgi:WD40 repeat protein
MKKIRITKFILVLVMFCTVMGCSSTPASPTQPPVESPTTAISTLTSTPALTSTPQPTATAKPATPTLKPEPGLQTNGPFLAYFKQDEHGIRRLVLMDANGVGRKVIELPKEIAEAFAVVQPPVPDVRWLSPDGKWLAFYTGSAGDHVDTPASGTFDLTLNLLDLATGEEQVITPLLSKDYPNNFVEAAGQLNDPDITAEYLYQAFVYGITRALAWSPDGRYLAFAGQMDGLSSDLYLYDVETKTIRRLSSGDQELQWIDWSPDGKWILHSGVYWVGTGMRYDIYAATIDGASAPYISTNIKDNGIDTWLNTHQYLESDGENVVGLYGLRLVDIDTGKITRIWDGSFYSYAVEKGGKWVAVFVSSPDASPVSANGDFVFDFDFVPAIYLINLATLEKSRVEFPDQGPIEAFGLEGRDFVITTENPVFLSIQGSLAHTDLGDVKLSIAPNSEYWLAATSKSVQIFAPDSALIKKSDISLSNSFITDILWRPDSSGLFLISASEIVSMNIPNGDTKMVETDLLVDNYHLTYKWIDGQ